MPFSVQLGMASGDDWFTPSFVTHADAVAASEVAPLANDPNLIGWYTDSELHWGPGGTELRPVLDTYLALPTGSPGHAVAEQYVGNPNGFVYALATRYFQVTTAAVRMYDTHHLILGVKATSQEIQPQLLEAASPYVDVFSIDDYALSPGLANLIDGAFPQYLALTPTLANLEKYVQRPIMVAEYSFRAITPQTPDTVPGVYATYPTQQARAAAYTNYIAPLYLHAPWVVGDEWFEYVDEPQGGRFDGENDNFGVVDVEDQPYQDLVTQMEILHSMAPDRVAQSGPACDSWADNTGQVTCTATLPQVSYPLSVFSTSLPGATQGAAYANYVIAEGGRPGYTFALPSQAIPARRSADRPRQGSSRASRRYPATSPLRLMSPTRPTPTRYRRPRQCPSQSRPLPSPSRPRCFQPASSASRTPQRWMRPGGTRHTRGRGPVFQRVSPFPRQARSPERPPPRATQQWTSSSPTPPRPMRKQRHSLSLSQCGPGR